MTKMKLSDAIRIGSKLRPPSQAGWSDLDQDGQPRSCPLLAAAEAYGLVTVQDGKFVPGPKWLEPAQDPQPRNGVASCALSRFPDEWAAILWFTAASPCDCGPKNPPADVGHVATHLYDVHKWPREEVATWIEQMELKLDERQWIAAKGPGTPWKPGMDW